VAKFTDWDGVWSTPDKNDWTCCVSCVNFLFRCVGGSLNRFSIGWCRV